MSMESISSAERDDEYSGTLSIPDKVDLLINRGLIFASFERLSLYATLVAVVIFAITAFFYSAIPTGIDESILVQDGTSQRLMINEISWNGVIEEISTSIDPSKPILDLLSGQDINEIKVVESIEEPAFNESERLPFQIINLLEGTIGKFIAVLFLIVAVYAGVMKQQFAKSIMLFFLAISLSYMGDVMRGITGFEDNMVNIEETENKYVPVDIEELFIATQVLHRIDTKEEFNFPMDGYVYAGPKASLELLWKYIKETDFVFNTIIGSVENEELYLIDNYINQTSTLAINFALEKHVEQQNRRVDNILVGVGTSGVISLLFALTCLFFRKTIQGRIHRINKLLLIDVKVNDDIK